ncbi:cellulase family glycosylhydrolase [Corynebacterium halotolerans]|uniref:cellulase family glycosylhydrolase n=1 Tax=Corynebacterium halotolerans TaxID=225326 RepID=UPI003CF71144
MVKHRRPARPRDPAWPITLLAVLLSAVAVLAITGPLGQRFERTPVAMPEDGTTGCTELGMAGPYDWEFATETEFRTMAHEMSLLGATWIRLSATWQEIEPERGHYDWSGLDQRLNIALDAGLQPILLIHTTPDWVAGFGVIGSGAAAEYADFSAAVAERYRSEVAAYEIWNEPNLARFWPDPSAESYAELLTATAPRIAAADPDAEIIAGGLAPAANIPDYSVSGYTFLERLYELDALGDTTAIAMHPYSYPERPSGTSRWNTFRQLTAVKELMRDNGDGGKRIWLTEFGAPTQGTEGVGEEEQSAIVTEALQLVADDPALGPIFMYTLYDLDLGEEDHESHFGLLYGPGRPKLAYHDLRATAAECAGRGVD